jgi:hypothetical protein
MKPGSFTKYLRGDRRPGARILERLTRMGVNLNWFLTGDGPMILPERGLSLSASAPNDTRSMTAAELRDAPTRYHPVSFVQVRVDATGDLHLDEIDEPEWLSASYIRRQYDVAPERLRKFRVSDNRMAPVIQAGDRVRAALLSADAPPEQLIDQGPHLLFGPDGVFSARLRTDESLILLHGDNPDATVHEVPPSDWGEGFRPIARILEVLRPL